MGEWHGEGMKYPHIFSFLLKVVSGSGHKLQSGFFRQMDCGVVFTFRLVRNAKEIVLNDSRTSTTIHWIFLFFLNFVSFLTQSWCPKHSLLSDI